MTPVVSDGFYSSWAQYILRLEDKEQRDGLQSYLKEKRYTKYGLLSKTNA